MLLRAVDGWKRPSLSSPISVYTFLLATAPIDQTISNQSSSYILDIKARDPVEKREEMEGHDRQWGDVAAAPIGNLQNRSLSWLK